MFLQIGPLHVTVRRLAPASRPSSTRPPQPRRQRPRAALFLRELAKGKSPAHAAQVAGLARSTAYLFRSQDTEFARQWLEASAEGVDRLEDEAHRRAVEGVKRPMFHGGKKVSEITEYSNILLVNLLRRRRPEVYGLRHDSTTRGNVTIPSLEDAKKHLENLGLPVPVIETDYEEIDASDPDQPKERA